MLDVTHFQWPHFCFHTPQYFILQIACSGDLFCDDDAQYYTSCCNSHFGSTNRIRPWFHHSDQSEVQTYPTTWQNNTKCSRKVHREFIGLSCTHKRNRYWPQPSPCRWVWKGDRGSYLVYWRNSDGKWVQGLIVRLHLESHDRRMPLTKILCPDLRETWSPWSLYTNGGANGKQW